MAQQFTSKATSINRDKLPAVFKKANFSARLIFDYGAGKYTEHIDEYVRSVHKTYLPYDPYNLPDDVNSFSVTLTINAMYLHMPVDVVCSNVLNVIDDDETVQKVARHIEEIVQGTGGRGFVTVYEGNRSGDGRQTGPDQFQRNAPLKSYLRFFRNASIKNGMIVVEQIPC